MMRDYSNPGAGSPDRNRKKGKIGDLLASLRLRKRRTETTEDTTSTQASETEAVGSSLLDADVFFHNAHTSCIGTNFTVDAPPGKLGIVVDTPNDDKEPPIVHAVKKTSPLFGQIKVGDWILALDGQDVSKLTAIKVAKMVSNRHKNPVRRFTLRRPGPPPDPTQPATLSAAVAVPKANPKQQPNQSDLDEDVYIGGWANDESWGSSGDNSQDGAETPKTNAEPEKGVRRLGLEEDNSQRLLEKEVRRLELEDAINAGDWEGVRKAALLLEENSDYDSPTDEEKTPTKSNATSSKTKPRLMDPKTEQAQRLTLDGAIDAGDWSAVEEAAAALSARTEKANDNDNADRERGTTLSPLRLTGSKTDSLSSSESPGLSPQVVEKLCQNESSLIRLVEASGGVEEGCSDLGSVFHSLSAQPHLLDQLLVSAGRKDKDRQEMDLIRSNQAYWEFYLAMLERMRSLLRAGEVIASGNVASTPGIRNALVSVIQSKKQKNKFQCAAKQIFQLETLAKTVEYVSQNVALPGANMAGSVMANVVRIAGNNCFMPFVRVSYFCAHAQATHAHEGGLEVVLERACRCVLWACFQDKSSTETRKLPWYKQQFNRMAGLKVSTTAQEDGFSAAEQAAECIMKPQLAKELHSVVEGGRCSGGEEALHEVLAASVLGIPAGQGHAAFEPPPKSRNAAPPKRKAQSPDLGENSGNRIRTPVSGENTASELTRLSDLEAQLSRVPQLEADVRALRRRLQEQQGQGSEGQQAAAFVNPSDALSEHADQIGSLQLETARHTEQLWLETERTAVLEERVRDLEKVVAELSSALSMSRL